jgi:uncharacterized repeat protein (TIGR01451 family)
MIGLTLVMIAAALPAAAQIVPSLADTTCVGNRFGTALTCNAAEFTVGTTLSSPSTGSCVHGTSFTLDVIVNLSGSNTDRQDIGFFIGQQGNDPRATTAGNICSAAVFPTSPLPWKDNDGDVCGDFLGGGMATPTIQSMKVLCDPDVNGNLRAPYVLVYSQNNGIVCTGAGNVTTGTVAKCNAGVASFTNVTVTNAADIAIVKTAPVVDKSTGTITYSLLISNAGPDAANGTTYDDMLPAGASGIIATCGSPTGNAVCDVAPPTVSGTDVSGTVPTLPNGGSVTITITAIFPPGTQGVSNTATVMLPQGTTTDPNLGNNSSTIDSTLPVKLQNFDVK